jgi:hypothetical protein
LIFHQAPFLYFYPAMTASPCDCLVHVTEPCHVGTTQSRSSRHGRHVTPVTSTHHSRHTSVSTHHGLPFTVDTVPRSSPTQSWQQPHAIMAAAPRNHGSSPTQSWQRPHVISSPGPRLAPLSDPLSGAPSQARTIRTGTRPRAAATILAGRTSTALDTGTVDCIICRIM